MLNLSAIVLVLLLAAACADGDESTTATADAVCPPFRDVVVSLRSLNGTDENAARVDDDLVRLSRAANATDSRPAQDASSDARQEWAGFMGSMFKGNGDESAFRRTVTSLRPVEEICDPEATSG